MADLKEIARQVRLEVLEMIYKAQTSHIGSNFSCVDLLTVLYETKKEQDEIIVSKGWVAAAVYALLARRGSISTDDLNTYCKSDSRFIGLLEPTVPGVRCAGGSMGYGLPFGLGFALASRIKGSKAKTYVLMSDGEQAIGTTWESALIAAHHELQSLMVIIDYNGYQAMGEVQEILGIEPLRKKWESFGWEVREVDGHDHYAIQRAITYVPLNRSKPICIIAKTVKGKGVSFMENDNRWHYLNIDKESYERAKAELRP